MRLMPKQDIFPTLFSEFSSLLVLAASELYDAVEKNAVKDETAALMLRREQEADHLGMRLFTALHKSFVTPYDPEDIFALTHNLDDVMDGLEDIAHRLSAYGLKIIPERMHKLAEHILIMVRQIGPALAALDKKKNVVEACVALKSHEAEMDLLTRHAISDLFLNERDAIELIKQKEIYEYFEATADACAHVASIIGRIHVKGG